jgi:hypothetical protein
MIETLSFMTGLAALLLHELDAIQQEEWRFFLGWTGMSDETAYRIFVAAHLPLFVAILLLLNDPGFRLAMAAFLVLHAVVHFALRRHPLIRFNDGFSRLWIYGGAALGLAYLAQVAFAA